MRTQISFYAVISLLLLASVAFADSNTVYSLSNVNPALTTYGGSSYPSQVYNSLSGENAGRWSEQGFANLVSTFASANACLGGTGAGLTMTPTACVAYNAGWRGTETGSITFPDASTCWVAMDENITGGNAGIPNFTRVGSTHYLIDCIDVSQPTMVSDTQLLMKVVTSGGAITAVTDLRNTAVTFTGGASQFGSLQVLSGTAPIWAVNFGAGLWLNELCLNGVTAAQLGSSICANGIATSNGDRETAWSYGALILAGTRNTSTPPSLVASTANDPSVIINAPVSGSGDTLDLRDPTGVSTFVSFGPTGATSLRATQITTLTWAGGADLTEQSQERSTVSYTTQVALSSAQTFGRWIPSVASTIRRVTYDLGTAGVTCSPEAVQQLNVNGSDIAFTRETLTNGLSVFDASGLAVAVGANQSVRVHETVGATGCGTVPSNENVTIEYTTN